VSGEGIKNLALAACVSALLTGVGFWFIIGGHLAEQTALNTADMKRNTSDIAALSAALNQQSLSQAATVDRLLDSMRTFAVDQATMVERINNAVKLMEKRLGP
jgi:type II secretory pathway component PulM